LDFGLWALVFELCTLNFVLCTWHFELGTLNWCLELFVFAPEERDVYSYQRPPKDLATLGAKPGNRTIAQAGKSDCAPTELKSQEKAAKL
jgi:hypothetical protein